MRSVDHVIRPPPIAERVFRRAPVRARPDPRGATEPPANGRPLIDDLLQPHRRSLAELKAKAWGVAPLHAALAAGMVTERQIAAALATRLGAFLAEPHHLEDMLAAIDPADWQRTIARGYAPVVLAGGMKAVLLAPGAADAETIAANPQRLLSLGLPIIVGTPADLSDLVRRQCRREWVAEAVGGLARDRPEASANDRRLMRRTAWIAMVIVLLVSLALALGPGGLSGATGAFIGLIVLGWLGVRLVASVLPVRPVPRHPLSDAELPVYSILCALHREETVVAGLIGALGRLTYPRARLDIQLILEADDPATLAAVRAANPPAHIRTLILPPDGPRTKPKALMMALPLVRGDLLTVYDAEDRPDPGQLREAAESFAAGDERLGCLQAPLLIANPRDSLLTRFFAADYAAQFLVLLPALARLGLPIPLGGTSNHFRVGALRACGGWDPFNVTEDADLGFRLARAGWRIGTIRAPTWEEAPPRFRIWLGQRSRWFKGWLQTLAVLGRQPRQVAADLGIRGTLALMATLAGSLGLALVHPACIAGLAAALLAGHMPPWAGALALVVVAGHAGAALHLAEGLRRSGQLRIVACLVILPVSWLLIGIAAWRAVWQLHRSPFLWEKTAHGLGSCAPPQAAPPPAEMTELDARIIGLAARAEQVLRAKQHLAPAMADHLPRVRLDALAMGAGPLAIAALDQCQRLVAAGLAGRPRSAP
ncbi:glycosyl transferase [Phreatobacter aquaticus]|uniref:Glycosyl transferase n=1 Tax=Phreatobacter aquaticus TaxID=2570229 RepID=A0A4D7QF74_9HYPH|nr:glycosyltransferase family 2 protein [Phreatobacter aquaticus]QCK85808.1 glycosyl transferase [Phreatobacter aquaticus]